MKWMRWAGCEHEPHTDEWIAGKTRRYRTRYREIHAAIEQRLLCAADHRLDELDAGVGAFSAEAFEAIEDEPGGKQHFHGEADFRLPACCQGARGFLEAAGFFQQRLSATVEQLAGRCQHRLAPS